MGRRGRRDDERTRPVALALPSEDQPDVLLDFYADQRH